MAGSSNPAQLCEAGGESPAFAFDTENIPQNIPQNILIMNEKITQLQAGCKCGVYILINTHRDSYQTVYEYLEDCNELESVEESVVQKMMELDTLICIHFYPHTPIGQYCIYHYDLDEALRRAVEVLAEVLAEG